jgi:hypothetical protein
MLGQHTRSTTANSRKVPALKPTRLPLTTLKQNSTSLTLARLVALASAPPRKPEFRLLKTLTKRPSESRTTTPLVTRPRMLQLLLGPRPHHLPKPPPEPCLPPRLHLLSRPPCNPSLSLHPLFRRLQNQCKPCSPLRLHRGTDANLRASLSRSQRAIRAPLRGVR